ncbi:ribonuclease H [Senna tora]|uniref:Ribonuclease H n=1 Tax=Senna tora TaxID=362788 RepID=A0A834TSR3_9FABA|nr:ribonuclease H [Senna tora]
MRVFLWSLSHESIMTENQREKRRMTNSNTCKRCHTVSETPLHALRDCPFVVNYWKTVVNPSLWNKFFNMGTKDWIQFNLSVVRNHAANWESKFATSCWLIWKQRNESVFNNKRLHSMDLMPIIEAQTREMLTAMCLEQRDDQCLTHTNSNRWEAPDDGWINFNTDGSHKIDTNQIACGGVARNQSGKWIVGFNKRIGKGNALSAEIWGIWFALQIAWEHKFPKN